MSQYADSVSIEGVAETFGKPLFQITCGKHQEPRHSFSLLLLEYCAGTSKSHFKFRRPRFDPQGR